jgi:hypothetical protein
MVSVSVDGSPQPYGVMERRGEEEAQLFTNKRLIPAPQAVFHLGLAAFWYPGEQQLQTTDAVNLITVSILRWTGVPQRLHRELGIALARPYLGPSRPGLIRSDG